MRPCSACYRLFPRAPWLCLPRTLSNQFTHMNFPLSAINTNVQLPEETVVRFNQFFCFCYTLWVKLYFNYFDNRKCLNLVLICVQEFWIDCNYNCYLLTACSMKKNNRSVPARTWWLGSFREAGDWFSRDLIGTEIWSSKGGFKYLAWSVVRTLRTWIVSPFYCLIIFISSVSIELF